MSGRKQHYIPQVVQRGFEASRSGTRSQVFVFRKGRAPYLTSTEGAAAERDFYSKPQGDEEGALDDMITEFEGDHLAPILQELRSAKGGAVDPELAAVVVAHLAFRTAHVRDSFATMTDDALAQFKSILEDCGALRRFAGVESLRSNSTIAAAVRDELSKLGSDALPEKARKFLERVIVFRLRERFDDLVGHANPEMRAGLAFIEETLSKAIPNAHARALSTSLVPKARVDALLELEWYVKAADTQDQHFILPDSVAVGRTAASGSLKPFAMLDSTEAAVVIMPLSSRQLLIGSTGATSIVGPDINLQLAQSSLDFFISSKRDPFTQEIAEAIGTCRAELKLDLLDEVDNSPAEVRPAPIPATFASKIRAPIGKSGDAMKKALSGIVTEAVEASTVDRIESILVPANIRLALEAFLKRTPSAAELESAAFGTVEPIKVGSNWMCRIYLPRNVLEQLTLPTASEQRLIATRQVKFNLGRAHYFDCWARQCPEIFDSVGADPWDQLALRTTFRTASSYFGGMASALHDKEPLPGGDSLHDLAARLNFGFEMLREARRMFFKHKNVDQLMVEAVNSIEMILAATATVFGFLEAKNMAIARDSAAGMFLESAALWDWGLLFSKDLRRHYERRHRWPSVDELQELSAHVERLLWTIGVIVSKTDAGHWIDVSDEDQMRHLSAALQT